MPFSPPQETLDFWKRRGAEPATNADIASVEQRLQLKAPQSYVDFMKTFGNVKFNDEIDSRFECVYEEPDRTEKRSQYISFIKSPEQALRYYEGLQKDEKLNLPPYLFPFGMDYGQGELLIEFGQPTERVYYWDFDNHDWESGVTRLGFVANDMYEFINNLKPSED